MSLRELLRDTAPGAVGVARRAVGRSSSASSSPCVVATISFVRHRLAPAADHGRRLLDGGPRGDPHGAVQRGRPAGPARSRRATLARPDRDPGPRPPGASRSSSSPNGRPGVHVDGFVHGPHRLVRLRDHQHGPDRDPRRRQRRVVLRAARPALLVKRAAPTTDKPGPRHRPDRRPRLPDPRRPHPGRFGQHDGRLGPRREPQAVALGGDPAVDDVGQPGGHPPRQQRRHPGLPLVRARPPAPDGLEQPGRRRRDRPAHLERRGPAVEQRGEHLQPDDRRRDPLVPDDRGHQGRGAGDRRQQGLPGVLLQPDRLPPVVHAVPRRVLQGAVSRPGGRGDPGIRPQMHRGAEVRRACGRRATCSSATSTSR